MKQEIAFNYCTKTLDLKTKIESAFLELGERMMKIRDEELYKGQFETWDLFLEDMKMSQAMASKIINIYEKLIVQYAIPQERLLQAGGWSQLAECLGHIHSREDAEEIIQLSIDHSRKDLRDILTERKKGVAQDTCKHESYEISVCRKCGIKIKTIKE